jgi:hypothetical protein
LAAGSENSQGWHRKVRGPLSKAPMKQEKIVLFDIDNTIYNGYLIFPWLNIFYRRMSSARILSRACIVTGISISVKTV